MCWKALAGSILCALVIWSEPAPAQNWNQGVAVLGDSYSDEYQFYAPDRAAARNWVEILAATRGVNFGTFTTAGRGEPRNQGFAYNWARSEATTDDMIRQGQHTGAAAQVARGEVGVVWIFVGGNDFIDALNAADPPAALAETEPAPWRTSSAPSRRSSPPARACRSSSPPSPT